MTDSTQQPPANNGPLKAVLIVAVPAALSFLAKGGYITGLTPQNYHAYVGMTLDFAMFLVTGAAAWYAAFKSTRDQLITRTNALPGVLGVAVTPALDAKIDIPTVTTPERLVTEIRIDQARSAIDPAGRL